MKTVRPREGGASFLACEGCYPALAGLVWIVPGPVVVFGKCSGCSGWFSLRDLSDRRPGGKWSAPSGVCVDCSGRAVRT